MGEKKMQCPRCQTSDINDMLATFLYKNPSGQEVVDTTTLPKFLYYLEHPKDFRGKSLKRPPNIVRVLGFSCVKCPSLQKNDPVTGVRIATRRFGI
jgi:hypothetical protein